MKSQSTFAELLPIALAMLLFAIPVLAVGLPVTLLATHGFDTAIWPPEATAFETWTSHIRTLQFEKILAEYALMLQGQHPGLHAGGSWQLLVLGGVWATGVHWILATGKQAEKPRDASDQLGGARWATAAEKARMDRGIELGRDPQSNRPIRLQIESNLLTVAPPRTGKTSGLIINNLLVPDARSWDGPAVVIDPKGEVFTAVQRRRQALGRRVICFDLSGGAAGSDHWNPLENASIDDVARLQRIAAVLIPNMGEENQYFGVRGIDIFSGAAAAAIADAQQNGRSATPADIANLLADPERLLAIAYELRSQVFRSLTADLQLDERARDQLLSTARTAVQWLMDERFQRATASSTFSMVEIAEGDADLFIVVPAENAGLLSPLVRWIFSELFAAINQRKGSGERILMFVDEADSLGRFNELRKALTLMPGKGVSIWSFWQSFSQIEAHYGKHDAATFVNSAEVVTVSDVSAFGADAENVSRALGNFTALVDSVSAQTADGKTSTGSGQTRQAVPLLRPDELTTLPSNMMLALLNSKQYARHPLQLHKIEYFNDARFDGLHDGVAPVQRL